MTGRPWPSVVAAGQTWRQGFWLHPADRRFCRGPTQRSRQPPGAFLPTASGSCMSPTASGWTLVPTGAGEPRQLDPGQLPRTNGIHGQAAASCLTASGSSLSETKAGRPRAVSSPRSIAGGPPEPLTPEGAFGSLVVFPRFSATSSFAIQRDNSRISRYRWTPTVVGRPLFRTTSPWRGVRMANRSGCSIVPHARKDLRSTSGPGAGPLARSSLPRSRVHRGRTRSSWSCRPTARSSSTVTRKHLSELLSRRD